MKDRLPLFPGRVKLTPVSGQENTYDMVRADQPSEEGTPLNKNSLLKDATAALFGLGADAVPDDVFVKIKTRLDETSQIAQSANNKIVYGSFIVPNGKVTLPFEPAYVILSGTGSSEASIFTQTSYRQIKIKDGGFTALSLTGSTLKWESFDYSDTIYYIAINK